MISKPTDKSTFSPGSEGSPSDCASPDGETIDLFSPEGFHVSRGATPGSELAQKMTAISGRKWLGLLRVCGLDGCLEKMFRGLLESRWASTECFLTWRVSATPRGRQVFRLVPSTPRTDVRASGLWPTATANDDNKTAGRSEGSNHHDGETLVDATRMWATPGAGSPNSLRGRGQHPDIRKAGGHQVGLHDQVEGALWATPAERDYRFPNARTYEERGGGKKGEQLPNQAARVWATPSKASADGGQTSRSGDRKDEALLGGQAKETDQMWPTPNTRDTRRGCNQKQVATEVDKVEAAASGPTTKPSPGGALNPEFVSWLMGYPPEWLNCAPLAMPSSRKSSAKSRE